MALNCLSGMPALPAIHKMRYSNLAAAHTLDQQEIVDNAAFGRKAEAERAIFIRKPREGASL